MSGTVWTADGRTLDPAETAAHAAIVDRLSWSSLHWGELHPDALPHVAIAAVSGARQAIEAAVREQVAREILSGALKLPPIGATAADAWTNATDRAARIARGES